MVGRGGPARSWLRSRGLRSKSVGSRPKTKSSRHPRRVQLAGRLDARFGRCAPGQVCADHDPRQGRQARRGPAGPRLHRRSAQSRLLPPSPAPPGVRLPSAPLSRYDEEAAKVSHLHSNRSASRRKLLFRQTRDRRRLEGSRSHGTFSEKRSACRIRYAAHRTAPSAWLRNP